MLRGRTDRYHRLGFIIAFSVAAVATPIQMGVGDSLARWVYNNQPVKFAAIELVPDHEQRRPRDAAGPPQRRRHGQRRHPDPGPGLVAVRPEHGHGRPSCRAWTPCPRTTSRPSARSTSSTSPGTSWSAWAPCCSCCRCGTASAGCSGAGCRRAGGSCGSAAASGVLAVIAMEAGWVVSEVGRQPWIVYNIMKVEDAATANTGVWITFIAVVVLYLGLGVTTILVLRGMSRRFRRAGGFGEHECPTAPSAPPEEPIPDARGGGPVSTAVAVVLLVAVHRVRRVRRRRFRRRVLGPDAGGAGARRSARARSIDHSIGPVWEANHVWLIFIFVVLWTVVPRGVRLDHADAVRPADARRPRHRAARSELRLPQGGRHAPATGATSAPRSPLSSVLVPYCMGAVVGGIASGRVPAGGQAGDPWTAGSTRPRSSAACSPSRRRPTWPPSTSCGTPAAWARRNGGVLPPPGGRRRRRRRP